MSAALAINPVAGPIAASIRPPGSKSITNRALVCAALADGSSLLTGTLDSEDTQVMISALKQLGINVHSRPSSNSLEVAGSGGGIPALEADLFCANSGTTIRFLTALVTLGHGGYRLDGVERMQARPMDHLLNGLSQLGAQVRSERDNGCPPIFVHANGLPGGTATIRGDVSSQFLSGLLMTAAAAQQTVEIRISSPLVSRPYVKMTLAVMKSFGVDVEVGPDFDYFRIAAPQLYRSCDYAIEPDASAASYFWAAAAITGGVVTVDGLNRNSLQGDVAFVDCLQEMGCRVVQGDDAIAVHGRQLHGIDVDMNAISDTAQTLAAVALFADGPTTIRGIAHNRHKETDRIADLAAELRKLGGQVEERDDGLRIEPGPLRPASIKTYDDHRMAMSLALVGLKQPGVVIQNPACTKKTYPDYFADLARLVAE